MKDVGKGAAVAVVGVGAILPDAPDAATFWENVRTGRSMSSDINATFVEESTPPERKTPNGTSDIIRL